MASLSYTVPPLFSRPCSASSQGYLPCHSRAHLSQKSGFLAHPFKCLPSAATPPSHTSIICSVSSQEVSALPPGATEMDAKYMGMCISLARKALGFTSPNPMVGCVIVKDGEIVGRGYHPQAGEPHAEVFALREAGAKAKGATAYVSLEPCNHFGRTPPCTHSLIQAGVSHVVTGMLDPNPIVAGKGVEALAKAGILVKAGVEELACQALNEAYIHRMLHKKPFVTVRFSMSLDGAFLGCAPVDNSSCTYFSKLLQENDAIIVPRVALDDNPALLSSEPGSKQPLRILLCHKFDFPLDLQVFDTSIAPTLLLVTKEAIVADTEQTRGKRESMEYLLRQKGVDVVVVKEVDLGSALEICYQRGFCSVVLDSRGSDLSELGNSLGIQALEEGVLQKVVVAISPIVCGSTSNGPGFIIGKTRLHLERVNTQMSGQEVIVEGYISR